MSVEKFTPQIPDPEIHRPSAAESAEPLDNVQKNIEVAPGQESLDSTESLSDNPEKITEEELLAFLEGSVFPELGLSEEDRIKTLEALAEQGKTAEEIQINQRSFENIRETLKLYFKTLCVDGIADEILAEKEEKQIIEEGREKYLKELLTLPEYSELNIIDYQSIQNEINNANSEMQRILAELPNDIQAAIMFGESEEPEEVAKIRAKVNLLLGLKDKITGWKAVSEEDTYIAGVHDKARERSIEVNSNRIKLKMSEALEELQKEIIRIEGSIQISHECSIRAIDRGIRGESIVGITSLSGDKLQGAIDKKIESPGWKKQYKQREGGYLPGRAGLEEALGYAGGPVVYGVMLAGAETPPNGYGDVTILLETDSYPELFFSEGDSMPGMKSIGELAVSKDRERSSGDQKENLIKSALKRQLTFRHAVISKAARGITLRHKAALNGDKYGGSHFDYTEAHIIGGIPFDKEHIREIRVDDQTRAEEIRGKFTGTSMEGCPVALR
jgi:hypothetical protein